ncbi:hypothetical protein [Saccharibacillus alkalitolerans]|nr:hypothetical protein [Saccharibacillus alkalitolerans]
MSIDRFIWTKLSRVTDDQTKDNLAKLLAIRIRKAENAEKAAKTARRLTS